jgi:heat shock protein HtpX
MMNAPNQEIAGQQIADRRPAKKWSIVALGFTGVASVVVSYVLFLALAVFCLLLPILLFGLPIEWNSSTLFFARILLSLFGIVAGLSIFWSLLPRRNKFEAPGIPIDPAREPRLMAEIEHVAGALGEAVPREVYLIPEANAFVAQRSGMLGIGSRRILAFGLPLIATLSVSEFRALLAHEFAHFYSGDTRLGPWLFNARKSMVRVFQNLGEESPILPHLTRFVVVAVPYIMLMHGLRFYWAMFMRLTQLISRRQEFRSDEIACYVAGSGPFIAMLRKLPRSEAGLNPYWQSVVQPLLSHGYKPKIAEDFAAFQTVPRHYAMGSAVLEKRLQIVRPQPYDSHPPLAARIARIESLHIETAPSSVAPANDNQPAYTLFENLGAWESNLLRKLMPKLESAQLKPVIWEKAALEIYLPDWRKHIERYLPQLSGITVASLPGHAKNLGPIADKVLNPPGRILNRAQRENEAAGVLGLALAVSLIDHGWTLRFKPGWWYIRYERTNLHPHDIVSQFRSGATPTATWEAFCTRRGIGDWPLVPAAPVAEGPKFFRLIEYYML